MNEVVRRGILVGLAAAVATAMFPAGAAAGVKNGGFEDGLSGWTETRSSDGCYWWTYPPPEGPPPPPQGSKAAIVFQNDVSYCVLSQKVKLRAGYRHRLSAKVAYSNQHEVFFAPHTFSLEQSNQQAFADVVKAKGSPTSTAPGKGLATLMRTKPGDPLETGYVRYSKKLNKHAGKTVRVRFGAITAHDRLFVAVDAVKLKSRKR